MRRGLGQTMGLARLEASLPRESLAESTARYFACAFSIFKSPTPDFLPPQTPTPQHTDPAALRIQSFRPILHQPPPSMESESDHDHRDDESISEQEEVEETKPKSALKKGRDVLPPVERPELP